jgi:uncharacterized lipoprotein YbaY
LCWCGQAWHAQGQGFWTGSTNANAGATEFAAGGGWGSGGDWLTSSGTASDWKLGVLGNNTDTGVTVVQVAPGSAASRVAINPGDVIVCVDGDQVGRVGNRVFELSEEVHQHADAQGRVRMLVQDGRSLRMRVVEVQLDSQRGGLTGTLTIAGGMVPVNSIVTVELQNVTRPHFVVRNGQRSFRLPTFSAGEIPFALDYDPQYIAASDSYRIRAYITVNGMTTFDTLQPPMVLTRGYPNTARLMLSPVSYSAASAGASFSGQPNTGIVAAGYVNYEELGARINDAYTRYLGRRPTTVELAAWQQISDPQSRLETLPLELMASQEYFDRAGNNNPVWLREVFREVIGRAPSDLEVDQWMRRFAELRYSRMELLRQLKLVAQR